MTINNLTELQRLMEDFCIWHKSKYKGAPDFKRVEQYLKMKQVSICQKQEK